MRVYSGKSVFGGIAIGTIQVYKKGSSRSKEERLKMFPQKSDGIARQSRQRWNSFRICMTKR